MHGGFVDVHSHVVPSGDDGAQTTAEGRALCAGAARRGTRILFATPHVWPDLPLTPGREEAIRERHAALAAQAELELRLGFELTPSPGLLDEDPQRFALEGLEAVLMEVPFRGEVELLVALAELTESAGLAPVVAHPERSEAVRGDPRVAVSLVERGWLLQVNSTSLLGQHGPDSAEVGWRLIEDGHAALVGSDGHGPARRPELDEAYRVVSNRIGIERARPLFDGSALGLAPSEPTAFRVAKQAG